MTELLTPKEAAAFLKARMLARFYELMQKQKLDIISRTERSGW
jgi:hypothetical protein